MPWAVLAAGVSAAGSIGGGILGSNATQSAAKQEAAAQQASLNWIKQVYGQTSGNLQPFIGAGQNALTSLQGFYGLPGGNASGATQGFNQFTNTPFYQFPLQQATLATNRALAASGLGQSGGALRAISQLNTGYSSQGLGQYLAGLGGIASGGQTAAAQLGSIGVGTGAQISQANTNLGQSLAAGTIGSANALSGGIGQLIPQLTGNSGQSSYSSGGLIGSLYNSLYNPVTSLGVTGNTGGAGTGTLQDLGFLPPSIGGTYANVSGDPMGGAP